MDLLRTAVARGAVTGLLAASRGPQRFQHLRAQALFRRFGQLG